MVEFPKLAALAEQTDPLIIKRTLLESLDKVIEMCANRQRTTMSGLPYEDPDSNGINKAIELAGKITGAIGMDPLVLIKFQREAEKLVSQASAVLRERETPPSVLTTGESGNEKLLR